jgi:hypothetical protein
MEGISLMFGSNIKKINWGFFDHGTSEGADLPKAKLCLL